MRQKNGSLIDCYICKTPVYRSKQQIERVKIGIACSIKCAAIISSRAQTNKKQYKCPICNKDIYLKPSAAASIKQLPTCSRACRAKYLETAYIGEQNPHFFSAAPLERYFTTRIKEIKRACSPTKRNLEITLIVQDVVELYKKQQGLCHYSGIKMKLETTDNYHRKGQPDLDVISFDRKDSTKGYHIDNLVLCCNSINKMKENETYENFCAFFDKVKNGNLKMDTIKIKKLKPDAKLPTRAYVYDAGLDLYSLDEAEVLPGDGFTFSTGISAEIEQGSYLHIQTRSSMAKKGWSVVGGICDSSYKGELFVILRNISNSPLKIEKFNKIAQAVIYPIYTPKVQEVCDIGESERGENGFGSTGA